MSPEQSSEVSRSPLTSIPLTAVVLSTHGFSATQCDRGRQDRPLGTLNVQLDQSDGTGHSFSSQECLIEPDRPDSDRIRRCWVEGGGTAGVSGVVCGSESQFGWMRPECLLEHTHPRSHDVGVLTQKSGVVWMWLVRMDSIGSAAKCRPGERPDVSSAVQHCSTSQVRKSILVGECDLLPDRLVVSIRSEVEGPTGRNELIALAN